MFARFEVLRFDGFLRALDALGDHLRLDGHALFHAQTLKQRADPLLGEDAHQVVFKGEIEARLAGIALASGAAAELVVDAARLVALGAEDEEAAGVDDLIVLGFDGIGVHLEGLSPFRLGDFELLALVVEAQEAGGRHGIDGSLGHAEGARAALLHQLLAGHELGIAAEQNVGAAAGHVGGDGDHAEAAGLGHDFGFALMELGVEHHVAHAFARQNAREQFALFDGGGADQHGLLFLVQRRDVVGCGLVFFLGGAEDHVGIFNAQQRLVGGDDDDFELVDLLEFGGLGFGGAGHAAELFDRGGSSSGR